MKNLPRRGRRLRTAGPADLRAAIVGVVGASLLTTWIVVALQVTVPRNYSGWWVAAAMVPSVLVSMLLLARLPGSAVARIVTTMTLCHLVPLGLDGLRLWDAQHGGPPFVHGAPGSGSGVLGWAATLPWWLGTLPLLPVLLVVFPDGVPRGGVWKYVFRGQLIALAFGVPVLLAQADGTVTAWLGAVNAAVGVLVLGSGIARAGSLLRLWWRARGERRRQLKPFVVVAAGLAAFYAGLSLVSAATDLVGPDSGVLNGPIYAVIIGALPATIGFSVLRHRLFGVEVVLNRVAVAAFLSVLLLGVYAATTAVVAAIAGREQGLRWEPLLAAGAAVAALGPLYRLARVSVDRVMFGDRDRPDHALRHLAARLGATVDPLDVPQTVVDTVGHALRLPFVALDIQSSTGPVRAAYRGNPPADDLLEAFPIECGGEALGVLVVTARAGEHALARSDRALLCDLTAQAGPALLAGRLASDLADSRERLRLGRLDERSRLRRALHDGISPTLSGIAIAAAGGRDADEPRIRKLLGRIEEEAGSGAVTLQALLAGLRPPGLDDLGLVGAIEQRGSELAQATGLRIDLEPEDCLPALDPDVEQTAYLVTVEAMVNVARHACATRCHIFLGEADHHLLIRVSDDGRGLPDVLRDGDGLRSARERAEAFGGALALSTAQGGGTRLEVRLPIWERR